MYTYMYACVGRQAPVVCGWAWKKHRFARGLRRSDWSERLFVIHAGVLCYVRANKRLPTPVCSLAHIAGITVKSYPAAGELRVGVHSIRNFPNTAGHLDTTDPVVEIALGQQRFLTRTKACPTIPS